MTTWHKGPPPSIGWWPASVVGDENAIRWWNGKQWSMPARPNMTAEDAYFCSRCTSGESHLVQWSARWWE